MKIRCQACPRRGLPGCYYNNKPICRKCFSKKIEKEQKQ